MTTAKVCHLTTGLEATPMFWILGYSLTIESTAVMHNLIVTLRSIPTQ